MHNSVVSTKLNNLDKLEEVLLKQSNETIKLFTKIYDTKKEKEKNKLIPKRKWKNLDKTDFVKGNRNNFLFTKTVGMLYNGLITNDEVLTTLQEINDNELDDKEINKIAKSIMKYNIKPNKTKTTKRKSKGIYNQDLWDKKIHNYKDKDKTNFERQKFGQVVTSILKDSKTLLKLLNGYINIYKEHKVFTNKVIEENSGVSRRTIQRYRNEKKLEEKIKAKAFMIYIQSMNPHDKPIKPNNSQSVIANDTPHVELINLLLKNISFCYKRDNRILKFKKNRSNKLEVYENMRSDELIAA